MFTKNTVFIVGAGASHSFGYPLGSQLPEKIRKRAHELTKYISKVSRYESARPSFNFYYDLVKERHEVIRGDWHSTAIALSKDASNLDLALDDAGNIVIDHFLNENPALSGLGQILIAAIICESEHKAFNYAPSKTTDPAEIWGRALTDNYIRHIAQMIARSCSSGQQLIENKIHFVTFNYDLAIERLLYRSLHSREILKDNNSPTVDAAIKQFVSDNRVIHLYGRLNWDAFTLPSMNFDSGDLGQEYDNAFNQSKNMRLIAPSEKFSGKPEIEKARELIEEAEVIYFLGYGFDQTNNEVLGLREMLSKSLSRKTKSIYFTNYNNNRRILKRAAKAFECTDILKETDWCWSTNYKSQLSIEKSDKCVERAIVDDFDL